MLFLHSNVIFGARCRTLRPTAFSASLNYAFLLHYHHGCNLLGTGLPVFGPLVNISQLAFLHEVKLECHQQRVLWLTAIVAGWEANEFLNMQKSPKVGELQTAEYKRAREDGDCARSACQPYNLWMIMLIQCIA